MEPVNQEPANQSTAGTPKSKSSKLPVFFATPFRSWFCMGSAAATIALIPWLWHWLYALSWQPVFGWYWWHQHEMIYAIAVPFIIGFTLTASQNWTGEAPVTPACTALMIGLWLVGRLLLFSELSPLIIAVVAIAPTLLAAWYLAVLLVNHRNYRNLVIVLLLLALAIMDAGAILYTTAIHQWAYASIFLVIITMTLLGGRVIPFFTSKRLNTAKVEPLKSLEIALVISQLIALTLWTLMPSQAISQWAAVVVGSLHLLRWSRWQCQALWQIPILWSLHIAYLGIAIGWLMLGLMEPPSLGIHTLAIGGIGLMIIAFSGRVSLAHTGRPLNPPRLFFWAIICVLLALCLRVILPAASGAVTTYLQYGLAGLFWVAGFGLFFIANFKFWMTPRQDGKPG